MIIGLNIIRQKKLKKNTLRNTLIDEISRTKAALDSAYCRLDYAADPDLIDSSIYELNAAQKKYKFLLNELKSIS